VIRTAPTLVGFSGAALSVTVLRLLLLTYENGWLAVSGYVAFNRPKSNVLAPSAIAPAG
jgi:hypothetical protein